MLGFLRGPDLSRSSSSASQFPDEEAGQRGKVTCPRAPSTGPESSFWFPSSGFPPFSLCSLSLLCHLTLLLPLPPRWAAPVSHFLSPVLPPALPGPAWSLTSSLLCSPIAASAFFSRPLEPGEAPHPLFGQCFLAGFLPACLGAPPGMGCPFPSTVFLLPRGSKMKGRDKTPGQGD